MRAISAIFGFEAYVILYCYVQYKFTRELFFLFIFMDNVSPVHYTTIYFFNIQYVFMYILLTSIYYTGIYVI